MNIEKLWANPQVLRAAIKPVGAGPKAAPC
jgi:hypothetical protein